MSFFTQASFVMDPNVYGDGKLYVPKPTDGSGDLTFTRASTGTRVNSAGLIEKVRTNFVLHSEDQTNGSYAKNPSIDSVTAVLNPITGENNAFKIVTNTGTDPYFYQNIYGIGNGENTFSCWLWTDSGQSTEAVMFFYNSNGSEVYTKGVTLTTTPTRYDHLVNFSNAGPVTTVRIDLRQNGPSIQYIYTYGWQAESGVMTDYIPTTTSTVSVGPLANYPRLNYGADGCPSLLLEPQRTNLALYSEQFDNAAWNKTTGVVVTPNAVISPDGYQNADYIQMGGASRLISQATSLSIGVTCSASIYIKGTAGETIKIAAGGADSANIVLTGEWQRITHTATSISNVFNINTFGGATARNFYIWGAQLEAGAYATSYIPTQGSAVTRIADAAYKTGISSLIGQSEGTLFVDITTTNDITTVTPIGISDGTGTNRVLIYVGTGVLNALVTTSGTPQATISSASIAANTRYKMAIAYKENDFAFYVNGSLVGTDTSGTVPACSRFSYDNGSGSAPFYGLNNQALLFKTRLTNAELARLTSL